MAENPYAPPSGKLAVGPSAVRGFAIHLAALILLMSPFTVLIYKLGNVPGAVSVALAGVIVAPILGYISGKRHGDQGVVTTALAGAVVAFPFSLFVLWAPPSTDKFFILSALGYWAVPFFGVSAGLFGRTSAGHRFKGGT